MSLRAGAHLGPYEIQSLLGAGGMGEVYKALDTRLPSDEAARVAIQIAGSLQASSCRF